MNRVQMLTMAKEFSAAIDLATSAKTRRIREHYLGMSEIGGCAAEVWRKYHQADESEFKPDPQLQRIFDLGDAIESQVIDLCKHIRGIKIISEQSGYSDFDGRFRGHSDLVYEMKHLNMKVVADVKSMNQRNFDWFGNVGLRRFSWKYYAQGMCYTGYEKADVFQLIAYNKDTSEINTEYIPFDQGDFDFFRSRARMIIEAKECPPCERGTGRVRYCNCGGK